MEYSISEVARAAGVTSRTLRHYDAVGLLPPSRTGGNGYRFYDDDSLVRLQRIMLLRQWGLGLDRIREVLRAQDSSPATQAHILGDHLAELRGEQRRLATQIGSVERTIAALTGDTTLREGTALMTHNIFDGFDHTQHREEVEQRWGAEAYATSDQWWRGQTAGDREQWREATNRLARDWTAVAQSGEDPTSPAAQQLAQRHVDWLRAIPGTPAHEPGGDLAGYLLGLGEMYVADERFAANYGGVDGATFVRDALRHYAETAHNLT